MESTDSNTVVARTVLGEVDPAELGVTLMHEHPIHRLSIHSGKADNTMVDVDLAAQELTIFRQAGGGTVCDVTPVNVGRDPAALQEVSRRSGVHIVSALGLYQIEVWSDQMLAMSRDELADYLVRDADGETSGVRAGFIGEIASHNELDHADWRKYRLWDKEVEIFEAVTDAQRRTGLFVSTHASMGRHGVAQLRVIADAGGDTSRVIIGHCDAQAHDDPALDFDYYDELLNFGAMLEFDLFGWPGVFGHDDSLRIARLAELVRRGHGDRLLLSTDTCRLSQMHANGGRGFDYVFAYIIPALRDAGVLEADIRQMTVTNPARVLSLEGNS
jgi:phosphotriesterase-related protein